MTGDHREVFLHISNWLEIDGPQKGDRVAYIEDFGDRGPIARQVTRSIARFKPRPLSGRF
jgi:hypothetical protein